ncbi:Ferredoxin-1 [Acaryochloris thomasi RCC1774]|uniref:Ferredoxin-1 n=1 Tax=Acaryochloris thomasi RCC1774 TaxID=1764569 RepID=A0A2W1JM82_9CYAN|nr:2Fe-2S iron-sulfur cluster-binding protein [Acaryochloris thomasi]PZD71992.1 Ferredoxin-1 [Acaryochloris thomasi RCC1774]
MSGNGEIYSITLVNETEGLNTTIQVREDEYIYDAAVAQNVDIPVSCCAGVCVTCAGKILEGDVDQEHNFLKPDELEAGFVLTCRAYPQSNCVIQTHQEDSLLALY